MRPICLGLNFHESIESYTLGPPRKMSPPNTLPSLYTIFLIYDGNVGYPDVQCLLILILEIQIALPSGLLNRFVMSIHCNL